MSNGASAGLTAGVGLAKVGIVNDFDRFDSPSWYPSSGFDKNGSDEPAWKNGSDEPAWKNGSDEPA